ncbi:MAG: hypothetical protein COY40_03455 [Alphaproteobacteria bacterium CG_4_10_14_0_8_um_filter_53_9]|nr:MAG: hypothetical protein COY40_03455 [Alphaproteobacteria bacterium CG_4_10_14_0_8_um_filter_53_9]
MKDYITTDLDWDNGEDAFPHERLSLTGDERTEARLATVQVLFWARSRDVDIRDVSGDFRGRLKVRKANKKLYDLLVDELAGGLDRYETMLSAHLLENWTLDRLDPVLACVLMVAFAEMAANDEAPLPVLYNEYLNISKGFAPAEDVGFVNKVLEVVGKKVRGAAS